MKKLNKIVLIQWYLLSAIEIPVRGNMAIIGPNASGKSSILDAIQTVLSGANKNRMALNPGAGEKSHRNIREYCLGIVDDPNFSVSIRPRDQATTYLALGFIDEVTGEEICAGIAFTASLNEPEEYVEGRFIVPGLSVSINDFIRETPAGRETIPWAEVKQGWSRRFADKVSYPVQSGRFTKELFAELSEDKGYPNDDENILKRIRNAIVFAPITDTTEFVRKFILEQDESLRLGDLRHALKNYRDMSKKAEEVANRIEDLTRIDAICEGVSKSRKSHAIFSWMSHAAQVERLLELQGPEQDELEALEDSLKGMVTEDAALDREVKQNIAEHARKEAELNNSDSELRRKNLELDKKQKENEERTVLNTIAEIKRMLRALPDKTNVLDMAPTPLMRTIEQIHQFSRSDSGMLEVFWPSKPAEVDKAIAQLRTLTCEALPQLVKQKSLLEAKLIGLDRQNKELTRKTEKLRVGKAISDDTEKLSELLMEQERPIASTPLCDLVDVSDEHWRKTIESCLGMHREALIVDPGNVQEAIRVYRREGRQFNKGQRIVDTLKTDRWINKASTGSLAELVTTENPHAKAYINRHLGNVIRVETERELIKDDRRAATADLMLYSGGATAAMKPVDSILGRQSKEKLLEQFEEELRDMARQMVKTADELNAITELLKPLDKLLETAEADTVSLVDLVSIREECQTTLERIRQEIIDLTDNEDKGLKLAIADFKERIRQGEDDLKILGTRKSEQQKKIANKNAELVKMDQMLDHYGRERNKFSTSLNFSAPDAAESMEKMREKFDWNFFAIIDHADREAKLSNDRIVREEEKARGAFKEHWNRHDQSVSEVKGLTGSFEELVYNVRLLKKNLDETYLAEYRDKASKALYEAEIAFRAKFVVNLNARLAKVKAMISDLNRHLKKRPFHDEIYQFKWKNNPEFEKILSYIESIDSEAQANVGGLFDLANDPSSPHREAIEEIAEALKDEPRSNHLEDYKNYLVFDFTMQGRDGAVKTSLKQRIQKGSGGENQAPFYVAIGASLASAYRIGTTTSGEGHGGVSLALFDEAFNKLDLENCHNCLSFLKDIHLQVLLAAPDEKYGIMSENMDTVVRIFRDGRNVDIEIEYPTEEGKRLLRSDNPYSNSKEADPWITVEAPGML